MDLDFTPIGFEPMDAAWWPATANALPRPWPREAVLFDLRWWRGQERATAKVGAIRRAKMPGRPALCQRWGWADWEARKVLRAEAEWADGWTSAPESSSDSPAILQPPSSESPATATANAENPAKSSSDSPAALQRSSSNPPHARSSHRSTEAPITDHHEEGIRTAPAARPHGAQDAESTNRPEADPRGDRAPHVDATFDGVGGGGREGQPRIVASPGPEAASTAPERRASDTDPGRAPRATTSVRPPVDHDRPANPARPGRDSVLTPKPPKPPKPPKAPKREPHPHHQAVIAAWVDAWKAATGGDSYKFAPRMGAIPGDFEVVAKLADAYVPRGDGADGGLAALSQGFRGYCAAAVAGRVQFPTPKGPPTLGKFGQSSGEWMNPATVDVAPRPTGKPAFRLAIDAFDDEEPPERSNVIDALWRAG